MIRYIEGVAAMEHSGKEVYVRDGDGDTARLFVGSCDVLLTHEEMRHLSQCLKHAADRAEMRIPETPEEPKDAE